MDACGSYGRGAINYISADGQTLLMMEALATGQEGLNVANFEVKCDQCNFTTDSKGNLLQHKMAPHEAVGYHCDQCSYVTSRKDSLKPHKRAIHGAKKFECDVCTF